VNGAGLWGPTSHYNIMTDTEPPTIGFIYPETDKWYTDAILAYQIRADDNLSGIQENSYEFSYKGEAWMQFDPHRASEDGGNLPQIHQAEGDALQLRVRDHAGNVGISHLIVVRVDGSVSRPVIMSNTHPDQDRWYAFDSPDFAWDFNDKVSGADGYSWAIDHSEDTVPPQIRMIEGNTPLKTDIEKLPDGIWYFHLIAKDLAGNWSKTSHYRVKIDSTSPTARLTISGPAVSDGNPPLARSGPLEILLQTSETVLEPVLEYLSAAAASPIPIEMTNTNRNEWKGSLNITIRTGDGEAIFRFSARDEAGNVGGKITSGGVFNIDTLIRADADEIVEILCISEPNTKISLPPGAIDQDLRLEVVKRDSHIFPGLIAIYDFIPYNSRMRRLRDVIFITPAQISFLPESLAAIGATEPGIGVHFWDGFEWQKLQDGWTSLRTDHLGSFALIRSQPMDSDIMYGWAAPNPFTPNGSGDATDSTIFHVATKQGNSDGFEVKIYDINGRLMRHLEGGRRAWDGTDSDGQIVEGGLYLYQIHAGDQIINGTVVVLK